MVKREGSFVWLLVAQTYLSISGAFPLAAPSFVSRPSRALCRLALAATDSSSPSFDYSDVEVSEMESLIRSLSALPTDESRRSQVAQIFQDAFAMDPKSLENNGAGDGGTDSKRFCRLFDSVLIRIGDQVQQEAVATLRDDAEAPAEAADAADVPAERSKSKEELQLWALVDMMVQSKTIVKRASGELGKDGAFG